MPSFGALIVLLVVLGANAHTSSDDLEGEVSAHSAETNGAPENERIYMNDSVATVERYLESLSVKCYASRFYTIDGLCNNLHYPRWGAAFEPFVRDLPNQYQDGKIVPRLYAKDDSSELLPSARAVSVSCVTSLKEEKGRDVSKRLNQNLMQFGQYFSHDLGLTPVQAGFNCCASLDENGLHPDTFTAGPCFPIMIPDNDRYFNDCMPFNRSVVEIDGYGVAQQMNAATHFIDQSTVYGSTQSLLHSLREYKQGDNRVNVWPGLTTTHLIFHLEHNRVAGELHKVHPDWEDQRLFDEARAIVIAETQQLVYTEFLPIILGRGVMRFFGLNRRARYNPYQNPSIINSFQTAAFRYGHSQINNFFVLDPATGVSQELKDTFFRPDMLCNSSGIPIFGGLINSLLTNPGQTFDAKMVESLTDLLFFNVDSPGGSSDLVARNVQRGRDHGLPPFLDFLDRALQEFGANNNFVRRLLLPECSAGLYRSVRDVDLFVGGLYEEPVRGGVVGPTFAYLMGKQFKHLREGDRLFFDTKGSQAGFTRAQIKSLKQMSYSGIICRNAGLLKIQKNAFKTPHPKRNPIVDCDSLPDVDFLKW